MAYEHRIKLRKNDVTAATISVISIGFSLIANDIYFENDNKSNISVTLLRILVLLLTVAIISFVVRHYVLEVEYLKKVERLDKDTWLIDARPYNMFLALEIAVLIIISPPGYDKTFEMAQLDNDLTYSLDDFVTAWHILRFYLVVRLFKQYTPWTELTAERKCERFGASADTFFATKCYLNA
jgi:hypothetical protein